MVLKLKKLLVISVLGIVFSCCTKEVPKELLNTNKQPSANQQIPDDSIHRNLTQTQKKEQTEQDDKKIEDEKLDKLIKEADETDARYQKTKSEADKTVCIQKQLAAANYLMFEADLSPKKKYRQALRRYRRILEIDPKNKEAAENKKQIEEIYQSMDMPIPE